jgi:RNA polymerase sigma factor (TIGR02999 family)
VSDVTRLLNAVEKGEPQTAEELLPLVYEELRRLAHARMVAESPGQTLQPTALVHEAYLRLTGGRVDQWENSSHFFCAAAEAMRRILVESARRKQRLKRGGGERPTSLDFVDLPIETNHEKLLLVHEALDQFATHAPLKAEVVKLRYFAGLNHQDIAQVLQLSEKTVRRHWLYAKAWLTDFLKDDVRGLDL